MDALTIIEREKVLKEVGFGDVLSFLRKLVARSESIDNTDPGKQISKALKSEQLISQFAQLVFGLAKTKEFDPEEIVRSDQSTKEQKCAALDLMTDTSRLAAIAQAGDSVPNDVRVYSAECLRKEVARRSGAIRDNSLCLLLAVVSTCGTPRGDSWIRTQDIALEVISSNPVDDPTWTSEKGQNELFIFIYDNVNILHEKHITQLLGHLLDRTLQDLLVNGFEESRLDDSLFELIVDELLKRNNVRAYEVLGRLKDQARYQVLALKLLDKVTDEGVESVINFISEYVYHEDHDKAIDIIEKLMYFIDFEIADEHVEKIVFGLGGDFLKAYVVIVWYNLRWNSAEHKSEEVRELISKMQEHFGDKPHMILLFENKSRLEKTLNVGQTFEAVFGIWVRSQGETYEPKYQMTVDIWADA